LQFFLAIMQIPYDLEFVENRPTVQVRAVALDDTYPFRAHGRGRREDAFDALLRWVHRMISRIETSRPPKANRR
jgi:hypothetical protein